MPTVVSEGVFARKTQVPVVGGNAPSRFPGPVGSVTDVLNTRRKIASMLGMVVAAIRAMGTDSRICENATCCKRDHDLILVVGNLLLCRVST